MHISQSYDKQMVTERKYSCRQRYGAKTLTKHHQHCTALLLFRKNSRNWTSTWKIFWFKSTGEKKLKMNRSSDVNEHRMNKTYLFLIQEKERLVQQ